MNGTIRKVKKGLKEIPFLIFLSSCSILSCDKGSASPAAGRAEQIVATGNMPTAAPSASDPPHAAPAPRATPLCAGDGNAKGRVLSSGKISHAEAAGAPRLDALPASHGQWMWVNFWAAWCGPCKEELPRLIGFRDRLAKAGTPVHFVFVSLDDDERQLQTFLEAQPTEGLRSTLWLPDGPMRGGWLSSLRMKSAPELPEQALIDPQGRVRCFVEGAVEDGDYAEIAALVAH